MKQFIVQKQMINATDGHYAVLIMGDTGPSRFCITSKLQFFTTADGFSYCHPEKSAKQYATAIANGLNLHERFKTAPENVKQAFNKKFTRLFNFIE
jgi:hypothetical protein